MRRCPECDGKLKTKDSRERPGGSIVRRKVCPECGKRFSTLEIEWSYDRSGEVVTQGDFYPGADVLKAAVESSILMLTQAIKAGKLREGGA